MLSATAALMARGVAFVTVGLPTFTGYAVIGLMAFGCVAFGCIWGVGKWLEGRGQ